MRGAQGLGRLALAVLRPAARHLQNVPIAEPSARRRDPAMPVDQFVKDLARLEEFILVRAVHQLDAAKQQGVALERRQRLGQDMLDLGVEYGEMHRLGDMIRKFAFRPQEIADFAV